MKTMRTGPWGRAPRAILAVGALLLAGLGTALTLSAQDRPRAERTDCRCVDREGNAIPNCTCFRTPDMSRAFVWAGSRARLGVTVTEDQPAEADQRGARVESVMEDGPAEEAGLREGDVITRIDGRSLLEPLEAEVEEDFDLDRSLPVQRMLALVRELEPGQEVTIEYMRDGSRSTATVEARTLPGWGNVAVVGPEGRALTLRMRELGDRMRDLSVEPHEFRFEMPEGRTFHFEGPDSARAWRLWTDSTDAPRVRIRTAPGGLLWAFGSQGVELLDLNPELGSYFGTDEGVLVTEVDEASTLGLQAGDVVLAVGDREVSDADHLRRILRSYEPDEAITFRVMRQKRETSVQGRIGR